MTNTYRSLQITIESKMGARRSKSPVQTLVPISPVEFKSISSTRFKGGKRILQ